MAGKVTVGTVYLKVQPDLVGFRRKVEQGAKGLDDVELDVTPDMDGFRQKVKSATKGMKAEVDVVADTKRMIADTKAAMKKISDDAQRNGHLQLMADFAHASADRKIKRFLDKANATSVVQLKVAGLDRSQTSKISDQIERVTSRDPVKIRFAVQRDQLNRAMDNVRAELKKFGPGTRRSIQLALGTSPKDSGSQRKQIAFLDQVKARIDKLKKPTSSPWENWSGKKLKTLSVGVGDLERTLNQLKSRTDDSWKLNDLRVRKGDTSALSDQLKELHKIDEQFKKLHQKSKDTGDAFPTGYLSLTKQVTQYQKDLEQLDKARGKMMDKWTREAYKPVDYGNISPDLLKRVSPLGNQVHKRTVREIRKEQLLRNQAVASAVRGYKKVADSATKASQKVSQETVKSIQRTKDQYAKSREALRGVNLLPKSVQRQMSLANAIDPGGRVSGSKSGQLIDRLQGLRNQLDRYKDAASSVATETRRVVTENQKAASSFSKLDKKTKNSGFGGKRRRGLKTIDNVGTERFAGLTRLGWIVSAIAAVAAPAVQLVSGLAAALPALGGIALTALGVTLLGLDGIKEAAQAAAPALERAQEAVSGVFATRMTPQFEQLGGLLDSITPQLTQVAEGMSDFSQGLVDGLTSNVGESNIQKLLTNTAGLFSKMKPFAKDFTEGLLEMAGAGSETFPSLADGMNRFGSSFKENIARLSESGQLQDAIQSTYDVVGNLGMNLGRILSAGIETAPSMSRALEPLLDGLTDGIVDIMPLLSSFSEFVGPTLGAALGGIGDIAKSVTPGLSDFFSAITPGSVELFSGLGDAIGALAEPFAELLGAAGPGIGDVLSNIGNGLSDAAVAFQNTPELVENFAALGTAIGDFASLVGGQEGLLGGTPLVTEADLEAIAKITEFTTMLVEAVNSSIEEIQNSFGSKSADVSAALDQYGGVFDRIMMMGTDFRDLGAIMAKDIRTSLSDIGDSVDEGIESLRGAAERAQAGVEIDLTPIIKQIDAAKTMEDLEKARADLLLAVESGIIPEQATAEVEVTPEVNMAEGAVVETSGVADGVKQQVETDINSALSAVNLDMSSAAASIGSQLGDALGGVHVPLDGLTSSVTAQIDGLVAAVSAKLSEITTAFQTEGDAGSAAFSGAMEAMSATSTGIVSGMASSIQATLSMDLTSNGASVGNTFAAGLESTAGRVRAAAAALAAAVDANMPHSPAKEGPLSGSGWVDTSGIAVGVEFAQGIRSTVGEVAAATQLVAGAVSDQLSNFQIAPQANMEAFHRAAVLQPVLESNAKKIADWRKREADRAEKHNERMGKIGEDGAKGEEKRVKAREDLAEKSAESYEKLLESLEEPDYGSIDRSIQGYWIDGSKDMLKDALKSSLVAADFTGTLQRSVKAATSQIRDTLGDHPILAQVEANVDSDAFHWAVYNAIEESGIHEVPINFAVANLDQLKSDLGMGDGFISRAINAAISTDPNNTDARRAPQNPVEIHYHVADMEEAIRLENERERKGMMKYKN